MASVGDQAVGMRARRLAFIALAVIMASTAMRAQLIDRVMAVVAGELITLSDVTAALRFGLVPEPPAGQDRLQSALSILIERTAIALLREAADAATSAAVVDLRSRVVIERSPGTEQVDLTVQRVEPVASTRDDVHRRVG